MAALIDQSLDIDKLSCEIFSILESKFLFSDSLPETPIKNQAPPAAGKVRVLSIDAAPDGGVLAALSLARLENLLKKQSGDPGARIADFFDLVAGSGAGGVLAAMLFTRGQDGRPLFTAEESLQFLTKRSKNGFFRRILRRSGGAGGKFKKMFADATLRDTMKPVLISCFDLLTGSPFMFSRSDAVESDEYDFLIRDVCAAATCAAAGALEVGSVDGRTSIKAIGGGIGMGNPTAAAITHVLNNKREFPFADGPEDLLVVSLGSSESQNSGAKISEIARIAGEGATDTVDQSVAMAFGHSNAANYVRIHANGLIAGAEQARDPISTAETALSQRCIESVMFRGKKVSDQTNGEKVDSVSAELIQEQDRRRKSNVPTVLVKPAVASPRTSSATTATVTSTATSASTLS